MFPRFYYALTKRENIPSCARFVDIPWPENDEALGDRARQAIDVLLTMDPQERPNAHGKW